MAINARFQADFSSFEAAVKKAEIQLVDFSKGAGSVEKSLNRMVDNFSGRKLLQDAALMQRAIGEVGGVSKLTDAELKKVNATVSAAVDKYKALGQTAPAGMQQLADATKGANVQTNALVDTAKKAALAFGAMFTARAALSFGSNILRQASELKDLSQQTHINVEELQLLAGAMSEFGVDADTLGKGLFTLSRKISGGDESVVEALNRMGLSLADVQGLQGQELFLKMEHGLATLQGSLRDETAADLFGSKMGMAMAGAAEGIDGALDAAKRLNVVMSTESVDAWDAYGESIDRAWRSLSNMTANTIGPVAQEFDVLTDAVSRGASKWDLFVAIAKDNTIARGLGLGPLYLTKLLDDLNQKTAQATTAQRALTGATTAFVGPIQSMNDAIKFNAKALEEKNKRLKEAKDAAEKAQAANEKFRESVINLTSSANGAAAGFGMIGQLMPDLSEQTLLYADRSDRLVSALDETVLSVQDLQRDGRFLSAELIGMDANMGLLVPATYGFGDAMKDAERDATGFRKGVEGAMKDLPNLLISAFTGGGGVGGALKGFGVQLADDIMGPLLKKMDDAAKMAFGIGAGVAGAVGAKVGGQGGGAVGGIAGTLGGAAVKSAMSASMAASIAGSVALGAATAGIGTAAVAAYYGLKKLLSISEDELKARNIVGDIGKELEKLVPAARKAEVGTEAWKAQVIGAQAAYEMAGLSAEDATRDVGLLWDSSRKGSQEAADAAARFRQILDIEEDARRLGFTSRQELQATADKSADVYAFMQKAGTYSYAQLTAAAEKAARDQAAASGDVTAAMSADMKAQSDARMTKLNEELDALTKRRDDLLKSVEKEAPERVMGVIEKGQRAEIANLNKRVEEQKVKMDKAAEEMAKDLQDAFKDFKLKIKVKWDLPPLPGQSTEAPEPDTPGFAGGTHGKYVDFGAAGTRVTLHGKERVVTEAEGQASRSGTAAILAALESQTIQLADLPRVLARSMVSEMAKAGIGR